MTKILIGKKDAICVLFIFAKAGSNAENITTAVIRAQGMPYDGNKEIEAYEYGLEQRKRGNGQDLDLLIEATDYLDSIGESGIMEDVEYENIPIDNKTEMESFDEYIVRNPDATELHYHLYKEIKTIGEIGIINVPPKKINKVLLILDTEHINERQHGVTVEDAISFIENAKYSVERKHWSGYTFINYYSEYGAAYVRVDDNVIRTAFKSNEYKGKTKLIWEEILNE